MFRIGHIGTVLAPALFVGLLLAGGCGGKSDDADGRRARVIARDDQERIEVAETAVRRGDLDAALREFARAIEENPQLTRAHLGVADIHRANGDFEQAQEAYAQAAELEPRNPSTHYYNGLMLHLLDRFTEAIQAYLRALSIDPDDFLSNLNLASAYYQLDENELAIEPAERAVRLRPNDGTARFNLAAVYASVGRHEDAVREYQQATELMELTPDLLFKMSESLGKLSRYAEMANTLRVLSERNPSAVAFQRLGFAEFQRGNYAEATVAFERAIEIEPDHYPALNGVGVCRLNDWLNSGRTDGAARMAGVRALRRSLQINGDQKRVIELLSRYGR